MAVSKNTRRSVPDTNALFQTFFQNSQVSREREREWQEAVRHAGTGTPPLRFPVYEDLYFLNVYAQRMVDLLHEIASKFSLSQESCLYHESLVQYVRASASQELSSAMAGIEQTEEWLFESQRRVEEKKLHDPDDVYFLVRDREKERIQQGLPPRIRFLDQNPAASEQTDETETQK
jgi:hypothetical protein